MSLWLGSFAYLALVSAFICTAVKEDDDRELLLKTGSFLGMIAVGTVGFCAAILLIERLT
jgi:hypothetical protein